MTTTSASTTATARTDRPAVHQTNLAQQSWIMVRRNLIHTRRMPRCYRM